MQLTDAAHFKNEGAPKTVASFMNFMNEPAEKELTPEETYSLIDSQIFGL